MSPEAQNRQRHLDAFLKSRSGHTWLHRGVVIDECASTQDEAFIAAAGKPGILVTALRQTKGRGRAGREWAQKSDLGLACTFVLDGEAHLAASLPIRMACAVCRAGERATGIEPDDLEDSIPCFRIKWPNDVVVSRELHDRHAPHRKVAGVLIEKRDSLLLVGIGINVLQQERDFPERLRERAGSMAMLGGKAPCRDGLLHGIIEAMDYYLFTDRREIRQDFRRRDVLTGSRCCFEHDRKLFDGIVESIDPMSHIVLKLDGGESVTLPAMTTTLVPAERCASQ